MVILSPSRIKQEQRTMNRLSEVFRILAKHGVDDMLDRSGLGGLVNLERKHPDRKEGASLAHSLTDAFEELGPTFIKLGQLLSTRPDMIPREYVKEFRRLQDQAPAFDFEDVRLLFQTEFGTRIEDLFQEFEKEPVAAASLSQVHRAKLKDGTEVAVKVQRPRIRHQIQTDLHIIFKLVNLVKDHISQASVYEPTEIVRIFSDAIMGELNFMNEARNLKDFRRNFSEVDYVKIPKVHPDLTCTRILTMEFIHGKKLSQLEKSTQREKEIIAYRGAQAVLKQIFENELFHADPHPGNIFILPGNVICFLDLGRVGRINPQTKQQIIDLLDGFHRRDVDDIILSLIDMDALDPDAVNSKLKSNIETLVSRYHRAGKMDTRSMIGEFLNISVKNNIRIPPRMAMLLHTLMTIEGVTMQVNPSFNMTRQTRSYIGKMKASRYSPSAIFQRAKEFTFNTIRLLDTLPEDINWALKTLRKNNFRFSHRLEDLDELIDTIDVASNRISMSLIVSAIIIGSSFVIQTGLGPLLYGYPLLGLVGYSIASILGMGIVISIIRSGNM